MDHHDLESNNITRLICQKHLPQELLNAWVWFRWRFGAGLWRCSALTVTEMGTHIARFIPGEGKGGVEVTELMSHTGGWLFTAPDTQETNTQVTANPQVFPGGRRRTSIPTSCTWSPCSSWRDRGGQKQEKQKYTHPSGCTETHRRLPVQRSVGLCALVVQEEKQTETQVVRILIFGMVAVEVLVALFLVLLKKLHRHKLKTIFNFKMT